MVLDDIMLETRNKINCVNEKAVSGDDTIEFQILSKEPKHLKDGVKYKTTQAEIQEDSSLPTDCHKVDRQ